MSNTNMEQMPWARRTWLGFALLALVVACESTDNADVQATDPVHREDRVEVGAGDTIRRPDVEESERVPLQVTTNRTESEAKRVPVDSGKRSPMTAMTNENLMGLSGEEYWTDPWKNAMDLHRKYVMEMKFGLYVDAPAKVSPNEHDTLPMPFLYVSTMRDSLKYPLQTVAQVVAVRLDDRAFKVGSALPPLDNEIPPGGVPSNDPTSERHVIDLHRQLGLLDEKGTYVARVLIVDKTSNAVQIEVMRKKPESDDPEVVKFLEERRTAKVYPPPAPPSTGIVFAEGEGSPAIPAEDGIALAVERVVLLEEGATAILKGSFRTTALPQELVPRGERREERLPLPDYGEPRPTAIIPITLLIVGSDRGSVTQINVRAPVYDELNAEQGVMAATGHFALDLLANENLTVTPQTFYIYAFCGEAFSGPQAMATVTEEMLPQPGE